MSGGRSSEHSVTWRQLGARSPTRAVSVRSWKDSSPARAGGPPASPAPQRLGRCPCLRQASQQHLCEQAVPCPGGLAGTPAPLLPCPLAPTFLVHELSCCTKEAKPGGCPHVSLGGCGRAAAVTPSVGLGGRRLFFAVTQDVWGSGWELRSLFFCPGGGPRALHPRSALTGPQPQGSVSAPCLSLQ